MHAPKYETRQCRTGHGVFTPVWHGLCARVSSATGCIRGTSEVGTVILYTIAPGSAVQFNSSVSAMPPTLPHPLRDACAFGHGGYTAFTLVADDRNPAPAFSVIHNRKEKT